jgi:hypothetical protein
MEHGDTGRIEVHVRAILQLDDGSTHEGPITVYGIDAVALQRAHNGDPQSFLDWIKREHTQTHRVHQQTRKHLLSMKGKEL